MTNMQLVPAPYLAPSRCLHCARHAGEMVDLLVRSEDPATSPYLCIHCALELARLIGCLVPDELKALEDELEGARAAIRGLEHELEHERSAKTISLDEAEALIIERMRSKENVPAPTFEGPSVNQWEKQLHEASSSTKAQYDQIRRCSAMRSKTRRCQQLAVPGSKPALCKAHLKAREQKSVSVTVV